VTSTASPVNKEKSKDRGGVMSPKKVEAMLIDISKQ